MIPVYKTDIGASKQAYSMINAKSLKFVGFQVGTGGCRDGQVLTVNRSDTFLSGKVAELDSSYITTEIVNGTSIRLKCKVTAATVASDIINNIAIVAQVVGEETQFLYCIGNFRDVPISGTTIIDIVLKQ